jgi:hypothetical protein
MSTPEHQLEEAFIEKLRSLKHGCRAVFGLELALAA